MEAGHVLEHVRHLHSDVARQTMDVLARLEIVAKVVIDAAARVEKGIATRGGVAGISLDIQAKQIVVHPDFLWVTGISGTVLGALRLFAAQCRKADLLANRGVARLPVGPCRKTLSFGIKSCRKSPTKKSDEPKL